MPGLSHLMKFLGGIAQQRKIPKFARETFRAWFQKQGIRNQGSPQVMLWPDTFNNHLHPDIAKAAVEVLEHAGYQVTIPKDVLCCGRPLYDFGMLDTAKELLNRVLTSLRPQIAAGLPVIGLEPSCISVFRDEMPNLLAHNKDAERLSRQTFLLSEFLVKKANYQPPQLKRKAIVHGHCHHKSILKFDSEQELLKRIGLDFQVLDSGCCGMAGSFGFEAGKYDVSVKIGERVLLPAVRNAGRDTLIITDGFSCFEQIEGLAGRKALHIAEVLHMAIQQEKGKPEADETKSGKRTTAAWIGAGILVAASALYFGLKDGNQTQKPNQNQKQNPPRRHGDTEKPNVNTQAQTRKESGTWQKSRG